MKTFLLILATFLLTLPYGHAQVQGQCNAFYPMQDGIRLEYELFDKKEKPNGRLAHTFKNVKKTADAVTATLVQEIIDVKNNQPISSSESEWTCNEGTLRYNMSHMNLNTGEGQMQMAEGMTMEVTGDEMDLPASLAVGQQLKDVNYNIKMMMNQMKLMDRSFVVKDRKVESKEKVTTPAGSFDCYKLTSITEHEGGRVNAIKTAVWYAENIGMVKTENYKEDGKLIGSMVLTSIKK